MTSIKCIQDIDVVGLRHYGANLLVMRNRQAIVQGDSTVLCSEAAIVPGDPSIQCHAAHGRDVAERHDMSFIQSSTSSLTTPS
jgi:hypothetical protein